MSTNINNGLRCLFYGENTIVEVGHNFALLR